MTSFFGRAGERAHLRELKESAWAGQGQALLVSGEPGIGKSRLVAWLVAQASQEPHRALSFQCAARHADSPFHPFAAGLTAFAGIGSDDTPAVKLGKIAALISKDGPHGDARLASFAELLGIPHAAGGAPAECGPAERRRRMLDALLDFTTGGATKGPVLLTIEDAHWADASSRELIGRLLQHIRALPVFVLVTCRPEFSLRVAHAGNLNTLVLDRLEARQIRQIVVALTEGETLSPHRLDDIVEKADGIPFFAEELTRAALSSQALSIPATLQSSLADRLVRLGDALETVQIGAAIGRDFSYEMIAAIARGGETAVGLALDVAEKAELVARRGLARTAIYTFRHALIQDAAHASMDEERRRTVHRQIAEAIVATFPDRAESEPETVARHFDEGGVPDKAIAAFIKAGDSAYRRSAYVEGRANFERALALFTAGGVAPDPMLALRLHVSLGQCLLSIYGFAAPETVAAFERAENAAASIPDAKARFGVYFGLWMGAITSGAGAPMKRWAQSFLDDALAHAPLPEVGVGHRMCGNTAFYAGDYKAARRHLSSAIDLCEQDPSLQIAFRYNFEQRAATKINLAMVLAPLGEHASAMRLAIEAVADALATKHFPTIAFVMGHRFTFDAIGGDLDSAQDVLRQMRTLGATFKVPVWQAWIDLFSGWARFQLGERDDGLRETRVGLAFFQGQGVGRFLPLCQAMFALAEAENNAAGALQLLDEHIEIFAAGGEHWFDAELFRTRAKILMLHSPADGAAAETALREAMRIAQAQGARTFALRAALDLADLCGPHRADETGALLAAACDGVSDETLPELLAARRVLAGDCVGAEAP